MNPHPDDSGLRRIADAILTDARSGAARPTITELARRAGITRPTLYRNHPDLVAEFLQQANQQQAASPTPPKLTHHLHQRIADLRRENDDLHLHVELYEEHIRRLTTENNRLTNCLAERSTITRLDRHRPTQPRTPSTPTPD